MFSPSSKVFSAPHIVRNCFREFSKAHIRISEEVRNALDTNKPIVALESTIVTHGMPFPRNLECALNVEATVRSQGAIPATVAIINGVITVGVEEAALTELADVTHSNPIKTSRRDLSYVVTTNRNGGTTVSGTVLICDLVGIPIFATGGIGGVHRGAETNFDVSADLQELGRSNIAVVSSGVKSILDIPKTLEYLETQGVFVATFGTSSKDFPGFYTRTSGNFVQYAVERASLAAKIINTNRRLGVRSGLLFAVPIPHEYSLEKECVERVVQEALNEAREKKIEGKEITPFLLRKIEEITGGKSLQSNIALINNNAKSASKIACELAKLGENLNDPFDGSGKPVVIGGSNLDCAIKLQETDLKMDGRLHNATFNYVAGGVGRNISEALSKLGTEPIFLTALGSDSQADILQKLASSGRLTKTIICKDKNTAQCNIILDAKGECKFLLGDMKIHAEITPEMVKKHEDLIKNAPILVIDANLSKETIDYILQLAKTHDIPVFYEPTDVAVAAKAFDTPNWNAIRIVTPNLNELKIISEFFNISTTITEDQNIDSIAHLAKKLAGFIETVIVTLGPRGVLVARKGKAEDSFSEGNCQNIQVRHYPRQKINAMNVSGAGDSLASAIIAGILDGLPEENCIAVGFAAAETALLTKHSIADKLFGKEHECWRSKATYVTII